MNRRALLAGATTVLGSVIAGCAGSEAVDGIEDTGDDLSEEAQAEVNDTIDNLERPPGADYDITDGKLTLLSLEPDTEGIKCGPIEDGDDPLEAVRTHEKATTTIGGEIENCGSESVIVAVTENGNVEVIDQI